MCVKHATSLRVRSVQAGAHEHVLEGAVHDREGSRVGLRTWCYCCFVDPCVSGMDR